jgi:hypothetical protein
LERPALRVQCLLAFWVLTLVASMMYWATFATSSQGRLLFPALSSISVILVVGLVTLLNVVRRWRWMILSLVPATLLVCSVYVLLYLLPASYEAPKALTALPEGVQKTNILFGQEVELLGLVLPEGRFKPGEEAPVTLYLRAPKKPTADLQLFVQFLDENQQSIGNLTTHPGWGRNPTSLWEPNAIYEDRYLVQIDQIIDNTSPLLATVYVGFIAPDGTDPLLAVHEDGEPASGMVGEVEIEAWEKLEPARLALSPLAATFEQGIRLAGAGYAAQVSPTITQLPLQVLYEAETQPGGDYTAFVHLLDSQGNRVSGDDHPPAAGRFPTHAWQPGDRILAEFVLSLPNGLAPGVYQLWSGLYPSGGVGETRLDVIASDRPIEHMSVLLGTVEVK